MEQIWELGEPKWTENWSDLAYIFGTKWDTFFTSMLISTSLFHLVVTSISICMSISIYTGYPTTNRRCWFWITDKRLKIIQFFCFFCVNWCIIFRILFKTKIKHIWTLVILQSQRAYRWSDRYIQTSCRTKVLQKHFFRGNW